MAEPYRCKRCGMTFEALMEAEQGERTRCAEPQCRVSFYHHRAPHDTIRVYMLAQDVAAI